MKPLGRHKRKQKRVGKKERAIIEGAIAEIKAYKITRDLRRKRETYINRDLLKYLEQRLGHESVGAKNIPVVYFVGETFRPEFYFKAGGRPVCAIECKRLTEASAKGVWKQGLSQALLYSAGYKAVILVLFDFTKDSRYHTAFGPGNKIESILAKRLWEKHKIRLIVLRPIDSI